MMHQSTNKIEFTVHFRKGRNGKQKIIQGSPPDELPVPSGRIPRISKLMALAIKMDGLLESGVVKDYAELAILGRVSRARITQIMDLLLLAPDIQEKILFLPATKSGRDPIRERFIRDISKNTNWDKQRCIWTEQTSS